MTPDAISAISTGVPGAVTDPPQPLTWPEDIVAVQEDDPGFDDVEAEIYPADDADDQDPLAGLPDSQYPHVEMIEQSSLFDEYEASRQPFEDHQTAQATTEISGRLRDKMGGRWPGAPGGPGGFSGGAGTRGGSGRIPPPDVCAFYLPWHIFAPKDWGIYLIKDGVLALGGLIHMRAWRFLSRSEANRAAALFLFHHEAYHNAVETFCARVEVSHRRPCYLTGEVGAFASSLPITGLHEEGLANAYGHAKVASGFLEDAAGVSKASNAIKARKRLKRAAAALALRDIIKRQDPPYDTAEKIISGAVAFDRAEHELMERIHSLSYLGVPPTGAGIWTASPWAMMPSIGRNRRFSYVMDRRSWPVRSKVHVPRFAIGDQRILPLLPREEDVF